MATEVKMPQLGESVHEGTIGKWLKQPGDRVARYEPLVEVITDKVNVEMPSPLAGVLGQILVPEGQTVVAGTPIAIMEETGGAVAPSPVAVEAAPAATASTTARDGRVSGAEAARGGAARLSPLVRRLAEEHHLRLDELQALQGSGAGGRVTKDDVLRYLQTRGTAAPAERMSRSAREIPHAYGVLDVDVTALTRHRAAYKEAWRAREGTNVSLTAFVVRALTRALRAYPAVNSTFTPEGILLKQAIHIGIGVAAPEGLIVPVIKHADQRSVVGIAREIEALASRARQGKLAPDDIAGGTFTLTNAGVYGSIYSMPIINYPQAAILSTDAVVRRPVVVGEGIAIRDMMNLGLGFDHRIFDGALAMQFLTHIKRQLEEFAPVGDSPEF